MYCRRPRETERGQRLSLESRIQGQKSAELGLPVRSAASERVVGDSEFSLKTSELSSYNRHRGLRQGKHSVLRSAHRGPGFWSVRISRAALDIRMPLILRTSKGDHAYFAREVRAPFFVLENEVNSLRVLLILVDQHQRPFSVRAQKSIRGHKRVSCPVLYVARARKYFVFAVAWLYPLLGDQFPSEVLRCWLLKFVVLRRCKHAERPR